MTRDDMLALLDCTDLVQRLPEVARLKGVPQPPEYHAEGDAFVHTRLAVAALQPDADARLVWATTLHDIGKADTTKMIDGRWRSLGHDQLSATMVENMLSRLGKRELVEDVSWLVRHHHFAISWQISEGGRLTPRQKRFCRHPLFSLLVELCRADAAGSRGQSEKLVHLERILAALQLDKEVLK
jgi:hypothetical protein